MRTILEILLCLICGFAIIGHLFRIIWLYYPSFLKGTFLHRKKQETKTEMLLYYLLAIIAMAYYITRTLEKIF